MDEVSTALVAIALTLCAVFVPSAFISGISGLFFTQFAATISASTIISVIVSLTLSPALCAVLLKPHVVAQSRAGSNRILQIAFGCFNSAFEWLSVELWSVDEPSGQSDRNRRCVLSRLDRFDGFPDVAITHRLYS